MESCDVYAFRAEPLLAYGRNAPGYAQQHRPLRGAEVLSAEWPINTRLWPMKPQVKHCLYRDYMRLDKRIAMHCFLSMC